MKTAQMCPKCQSRKIWIVDEVKQPDHQSSRVVGTMVVTAAALDLSGQVNKWLNEKRRVEAGKFEVWVCARCGFTEWYAKEMNDALEELAKLPGSGVRLAAPSPRGPFR